MKTKIFSVLAMGLAAVLMGAAPNANNNKRSRNPQSNSGPYYCGYYTDHGQGRSSMRGTEPDSVNENSAYCPYARGYGMMNGGVPDSSYRNMTRGRYSPGYRMMGGMRYGLMNGCYGQGYVMMRGCGYVMMPMMNMMRGRMTYRAGDSSFVCPYSDYHARPHKQKEGK